jgi:hypothetical protein
MVLLKIPPPRRVKCWFHCSFSFVPFNPCSVVLDPQLLRFDPSVMFSFVLNAALNVPRCSGLLPQAFVRISGDHNRGGGDGGNLTLWIAGRVKR